MIIRRGLSPTVKLCVGSVLEGVSFATHMMGGGMLKKKVFLKIWLTSKKLYIFGGGWASHDCSHS